MRFAHHCGSTAKPIGGGGEQREFFHIGERIRPTELSMALLRIECSWSLGYEPDHDERATCKCRELRCGGGEWGGLGDKFGRDAYGNRNCACDHKRTC